jgi:hypothetical protein
MLIDEHFLLLYERREMVVSMKYDCNEYAGKKHCADAKDDAKQDYFFEETFHPVEY